MRKIPRLMAAALTLALLLSLAGCGSSDGKTHLTFQIWDVAQRDGMQAMCDAYTAQVDPNVIIEVQVTNWSGLKDGEVYWSHPIQDGSGRGIALICSMPVYVDGELVGVAGSGGLIENIQEMVQSTSIGESGYAFLLNTNSMNVIANANPDEDSEINRFRDNLLDTGNEELTDRKSVV